MEIPSTVKIIGKSCFVSCGLKSVIIPEGVKEIRREAFFINKLSQVEIPESVVHIGEYAFNTNKLTSVHIPYKITIINKDAFSHNKLKHIKIPDNVKIIQQSAFHKNELESIEGCKNLKVIGLDAFSYNNFTTLTIPEGVEAITDKAFSSCEKIHTLNIPKSLKFIQKNAFMLDYGVKTINGEPSNGLIYAKLADGSFDKTHILNYVGEKKAKIVIPDEVERISELSLAKIDKLPQNIEIINKYSIALFGGKVQMSSIPNKEWTGYTHRLEKKATLKSGDYYTNKVSKYRFVNTKKCVYVSIKFKVQGKSNNDYVMLTLNDKTEIAGDQTELIAPVKKGKVSYKATMYHSPDGEKYTASGVFDSSQKNIVITLRKK